ncbi:tetratricopeptide repeat protein [Erythrobacter sp.]|uniref:tetratricopeptide repeat protein n=2 Tax=Sphingomonadales TaxID=204457 RepID=UPI0025B7BBE7|nr:tetratricopeptide repeat protein [Erythrobacter sp.]
MADTPSLGRNTLLETMMRFAPAAAALSLVFAVTSSVGWAGDREPAPRAGVLIAEGKAALAQGDTQGAIDAFEAALAVDPGHTPIFLRLAEAARADRLQGKAIRYYREALTRDPRNLAAIAGEGEALVEKGAVEKAKGNLARLESLCGASCPETMTLSARIAAGPPARVMTAEAVLPDAPVAQTN